MSYAYGRMAFQMNPMSATGIALTSGDKEFFSLPVPFYIREVGIGVTTAIQAGDPATVAWEKRVTAGSDSGRVTSGVPTVIVPASTAAGKTVVSTGLSYLINPGEEVVAKVTDATAAGAGHFYICIELSPQVPGNLTNVILTA